MRVLPLILIAIALPAAQGVAPLPPGVERWWETRPFGDPVGTPEIYKKTPSMDLYLWISQPDGGGEGKSHPAMIFFHGGGWKTHNPGMFRGWAQSAVKLGIVAVIADYRSTTDDKVDKKALMGDARSAMRHVHRHARRLGVDPQRIGACGGSAGAHLAISLALITDADIDDPADDAGIPYRPAVLTTFAGIVDVGAWQKRPDSEKDLSPLFRLDAHHLPPPIWMCYGGDDPARGPGEIFATKVRELGGVAEVIAEPGQPHTYKGHAEEWAAFVKRHLLTRPQLTP
jgi:acetyl esterase/lipase